MILKISNFIDASNTKGPIRVEDTEHGPILVAQKFNLKDLFFRTLSTINAKINSQILNEQLKNYRLANQKSLLLFLKTLASEKSYQKVRLPPMKQSKIQFNILLQVKTSN